MIAPALPTVAFQKAVISIGLNAAMFLTFLMGIYTSVYFGTVYLYVIRKASQARVVIATITMLYILNMVQLAIQWQLLKSSFVDSGDTRKTIFITTFHNPEWATLASQGCTAATNILADGLLIWRCFHVWDRSLLPVSLPFFFLVAETGIYSSLIILCVAVKLTPSPRQEMMLNCLLLSAFFSSFAATISSTILIVYRIYNSLSKQDTHSKKKFLHIVDVLVQSAAVYSLAILVSLIAGALLVTFGDQPTLSLFAMLNFESRAILFFVSGIAPTVMVARVALATDNIKIVDSTNVHISTIQFHGHSGIDSDMINEAVNSCSGSRVSDK